MTEPRPCPFCWAMDRELAPTEVSPGVWTVVCTVCGAQGPTNHLADDYERETAPNTTADQAVTEWNTRA